jgi:hypothetical protein
MCAMQTRSLPSDAGRGPLSDMLQKGDPVDAAGKLYDRVVELERKVGGSPGDWVDG